MVDEVEITKEQITKIEINENGVFDHLMKAVKEHLHEEFDGGRIDQAMYSDVYLGSTQTAMQQAMQFVLQKPINEAQAELLEAQKLKIIVETENEGKNGELIDKQIEKMDAEIILLGKQGEKIDAEVINLGKQGDLMDQQILKLQKDILYTDSQIKLSDEQIKKIIAETALIGKQEDKLDQDILYSQQQVLKSKEEVLLLKEQVLTAPQQRAKIIADTELANQQKLNAGEQFVVIQHQQTRTKNEADLVLRKVYTEAAQVAEHYDTDKPVEGIMGRKGTLYTRQAEAYLRDAEQKATKLMSDIWNVAKSTDPNATYESPILGAVTFDGEGANAPVSATSYPKFQRFTDKLADGIDA